MDIKTRDVIIRLFVRKFEGGSNDTVPLTSQWYYLILGNYDPRIQETISNSRWFGALKLLMKMNNQVLSLNWKVNYLFFTAPTRVRPPFPPTPTGHTTAKVDWCHLF